MARNIKDLTNPNYEPGALRQGVNRKQKFMDAVAAKTAANRTRLRGGTPPALAALGAAVKKKKIQPITPPSSPASTMSTLARRPTKFNQR